MKKTIVLLVVICTISACRKEATIDTTTNVTPIINLPTAAITGSVQGIITNEDGPVEGAEVSLVNEMTQTNEEGLFSFENIQLDKEGTLVKASYAGHITGSKVFYPSQGEESYIHINIHKPLQKEVLSSNGGLIEIGEASVRLPSGIYRSEMDTYNGTIITKGLMLDPDDPKFNFSTPGDLRGISENDELLSLLPYGMLKLSLEDNSGVALNLPSETIAELNIPISTSLRSIAPETIPLYYYEEENGIWLHDGYADRRGNFYYAEVDHFTFWLAATTFDYVELSGQVLIDNMAAINTPLLLTDKAKGYNSIIYTSTTGRYTTRAPEGLSLKLSTEGHCNGQLLEHALGTITQDIHDLRSELNSTEGVVHISGNIAKCNNAIAASNAYARIVYDNHNHMILADENGYFEVSLEGCFDSDITIYGIDTEDSLISEEQTYMVSPEIIAEVILPCKDVAVGQEVNYTSNNWKDNSLLHDWTISYINGNGPQTIIINPTIKNKENPSEVYMSGAFIFNEEDSTVDYLLDFKSQGFKASGRFEVEIDASNTSFKSYRFIGTSTDISITNNSLFPSTGVDQIFIDLVYYD